jgi:hypothetical protein
MRRPAAALWQQALSSLCLIAAATTTAIAALPGVVAGGVPIPAFTGPPGPGLAGPAQVLPLSVGQPVPASWPRPHVLVRPTDHGSVVPVGDESTNWSGYVDTGTGARFTGITGSWTVPTVGPTASGASSTWVGIDGDTNASLIQAGTEQDWGPQGVLYYAWYEMLPADSIELGAVQPDDRVTVDIERDQPGTWSITVDDSTEHSLWTGSVAYSAPEASAEWIEEAPTDSDTGNIEPLADYGSVRFSDMGVHGLGTRAATASPVYMVKQDTGNVVQSYPAPYDPSTDSFDVTFGTPAAVPASFPAVPIVPGPIVPGPTATGTPHGPTTTTRPPSPTTIAAPAPLPGGHGYWLVGNDGGVFAFGDAHFHGSTGNMVTLVRKVAIPLAAVSGIAPTADDGGYWLVTDNGGVFPFGDASYFGSLPAVGVLDAEVTDIVPTADGLGYFMVSWQGGVYAFGDARFEGSCQTVGGCGAPLAALVPDATGQGYWLVLSNCEVVALGDAPKIPAGDCHAYASANHLQARAAVRTPDGGGYWVLLTNGAVYPEGDAVALGTWRAAAITDAKDPAETIVPTRDGGGLWVVLEKGAVHAYGDAPKLGDLAGEKLSEPLISAAGW